VERTLRCHRCADVIGAYEPMVVLVEGEARNTSRAVERAVRDPVGECYHHDCYRQAHGDPVLE
jgi:hypothetical protein